MADDRSRGVRRWRLSLGRYAQNSLGHSFSGSDAEIDLTLEYLYRHEYQRRACVRADPRGPVRSIPLRSR